MTEGQRGQKEENGRLRVDWGTAWFIQELRMRSWRIGFNEGTTKMRFEAVLGIHRVDFPDSEILITFPCFVRAEAWKGKGLSRAVADERCGWCER